MELRCCSILRAFVCLLMLMHLTIAETPENSTEIHEASVEELPNPTMTIEKGDMSDYRLPGYYTFNNGEPFYLEKDPLTGAVDFSKKSPVTGYAGVPDFTSASKQDRVTGQEKSEVTESEYYEDDEASTTDQDFKEDSIDRKDGNIDGYRPNDIDKNPFKISPDLHQFLNLPVHYSSSDKFPLISSSYANTKIQGTGSSSSNSNGGYSNHKYATTSSTQSPSYYTFKPTTTTTSRPITMTTTTTELPLLFLTTSKPKPSYKPTTIPVRSTSITTTTTTTTATPRTTTKSAFPEYNEGEDLVYSDYDMEYGQPQNTYSHNVHHEPIPTTTKRMPVTIFKPTAIPFNDDYTTKKMIQNFTEPEEEFEEDISIVTSLPVDVYYSQHTQSTTAKTTSTASTQTTTTTTTIKPTTTTEQVRETSTLPTATTEVFNKPTSFLPTTSVSTPSTTKYSTIYSEIYKPTPSNNYHFYGTKDTFEPMVDEPFRPIFGPHDSSSQPTVTYKPQSVHNEVKSTPASHNKPYFEYHAPTNAKPLPNHGKIEFVERNPVEQPNKYSQKPLNPPKYPGVEPPRPNPPLVFANHGYNPPSEHFSKQPVIPPQSNPSLYNNDKQNINSNPIRIPPQEPVNFVRPQDTTSNSQGPILQESGTPVRLPPQNQRPAFIRLPDDVPFYVKKHSNGTVTKIPKPEEIIYPQQRPVGVMPPVGLKPEAKPTNQVVKFHPPMKHDNHFIKVPIDDENPSYSLQTSFSIGLPGDGPGDKENEKKNGQGVGQVLFPDGSVDTSLQYDKDKSPGQSTPIRNRPTNTRPYITTYNQNNHPPQTRPQQAIPPQNLLPQRPSAQRPLIPELRPPKPIGDNNYPRPHWENHSKPHILFNGHHNSGPKQELSHYQAINKIKPDSNVQRPDLPNILPQFRPNAKVGSNEFGVNGGNSERLREPMDILQPPPLPQPQHLRVNRNDDSGIEEEIDKTFEEIEATQSPLVHRRTGPQPANNRVTTLQMMQQGPPRRNLIRTDYNDNRPEKPVYLVYPANAGSKQQMQTQPNEGVVVVGTRGPHQPVPPSNLKTTMTDKDEDADLFPLDDEKQFSIPTRDRVDTPVLKIKTPNKPALKNDFPYEILKPQENIIPEERILAGASATKEYNAFSPTVSSSTEDIKDPDAEINLIPYLQDYMPIATKKPMTQKPGSVISSQILNGEKTPELIKLPSTNKPISVTLNTKLVTTLKPETSSDYIKNLKPVLQLNPHENIVFGGGNNGKSEYTVGAVMHTNFVKKPVNHRPFEIQQSSNQPKPVDLEAPFQASLSAPESQGWTVVKSNSDKRNQEVDKQDVELFNEDKHTETAETKFDFDNFKPQLFGGFKPIIPSSEEKSDNKSKENVHDKVLGRQEKTYR